MHTSTDEWAEQLKAAAIAYRRANRAPWQNAHADRQAREREARRVAKEYRAAEQTRGLRTCNKCSLTQPLACYPVMPSGNPHATCRTCRGALSREAKRRKALGLAPRRKGRPADVRVDLQRLTHLASALAGTNPEERISTEQRWDNVANELQGIWQQSGDKECVSCKAVVPPSAMLPPGPANFYPGKCRSCAQTESRENSFRVTGKPTEGPPLIPMRDGTAITVAEFARRVGERQQGGHSFTAR